MIAAVANTMNQILHGIQWLIKKECTYFQDQVYTWIAFPGDLHGLCEEDLNIRLLAADNATANKNISVYSCNLQKFT